MKWHKINVPLSLQDIHRLSCGDKVLLNGYVYTARDMAHRRFFTALQKNKKLPISIKGEVIYYVGPTPAPRGRIIGACGPTTSSRMDSFTPMLLKSGLKGMIGKGERSIETVRAIKKYKAIYFVTVGGAGAYLAGCVAEARVIAYPDLGPEAIFRLKIRDLPVIVAIDSRGMDIFKRKK
ncbi:MAG: fumarate hydratase C-terminal domain-containing protein [Candidatus Omnitrophica bacterium]|nr:fumarate hydratase C-terminal domain-containing protein [Candidatus Omnitrophota bacterium]